MNVIMEGSNGYGLDEVKKLRDIVKRLETENEELRNFVSPPPPENNRLNCENNSKNTKNGPSLEDVDLINIEELDLDDEESWLYETPVSGDKNLMTGSFLDRPKEGEDAGARRGLVRQLDEIAAAREINNDCGNDGHRQRLIGGGWRSNYHEANSQRRSSSPLLTSRLTPPRSIPKLTGSPDTTRRVIDTRTFTRPTRRRRDLLLEAADDDLEAAAGVAALAGIRDVQALARLQEESLREESNAPSGDATGANRAGSTGSSSRANSNLSGENSSDGSNCDLRETAYSSSRRSSSILCGGGGFTPPESPHSGMSSCGDEAESTNLGAPVRRSMPNLRDPSSGAHHPSSSHHQMTHHHPPSVSLVRQCTDSLSPIQVPRRLSSPLSSPYLNRSSPNVSQRYPSPPIAVATPPPPARMANGMRSSPIRTLVKPTAVGASSPIPARATRPVSPQQPQVRSAIPVPSSLGGTRLPRPNSTRLPMPKSFAGGSRSRIAGPIAAGNSAMRHPADESWKEGCF